MGMGMEALIRTGDMKRADDVEGPARGGRFGEMVTNASIGRYYELAKQGKLFTAAMQAGASLGTALTAAAVTFTLYNASKDHNLSLLICGVNITTEPAAGAGVKTTFAYAISNDPGLSPIVTAGQAKLTVDPVLMGAPFTSVARAFSACALPATPTVKRWHPYSMNHQTAVGIGLLGGIDLVDGAICLQPNTAVTLQGIGTAVSGVIHMLWGEIPI